MKSIDFLESNKSLTTRIDIHEKYGSKSIDDWFIETVNVLPGSKILDLGCGSGKQSITINDYLEGNCEIIGTDESQKLIDLANNNSPNRQISFQILDFDSTFPFKDKKFDMVISSFAIYYADEIKNTIKEIHRVLKPKGNLFLVGPMPNNKFEFHEMLAKASSSVIPPLVGSSRFSTEILHCVIELFEDVKLSVFKNKLIFPDVEPFLEYSESTFMKQRNIYSDLFQKVDYDKVMAKFLTIANNRIKKNGNIEMTKVVGGILASKSF